MRSYREARACLTEAPLLIRRITATGQGEQAGSVDSRAMCVSSCPLAALPHSHQNLLVVYAADPIETGPAAWWGVPLAAVVSRGSRARKRPCFGPATIERHAIPETRYSLRHRAADRQCGIVTAVK